MPRDPRAFITVHDGLPEHPKVEGLSDAAFRLLITCWCYCNRNLTDGRITRQAWERRGTKRSREELVMVGLAVLQSDFSVEMHDYTEHQRTAAEIVELREKRTEAGRKGGVANASKRVASAKQTVKQTASKVAKQTASKAVAEENRREEEEIKNPPGGALTLAEPSSGVLVKEWIDHCGSRPPERVVGQIAKEIGQMLGDGIPYNDVRRGLASWQSKGLHPSTLASEVHAMRSTNGKSQKQQRTEQVFRNLLDNTDEPRVITS